MVIYIWLCLVWWETWGIVGNMERFAPVYINTSNCHDHVKRGGKLGYHSFYIKTEKRDIALGLLCFYVFLFFFLFFFFLSQPLFSPSTLLQIRVEMLPNCVCMCVYPSRGLRHVWLGVPKSRGLLDGKINSSLHFAEAVPIRSGHSCFVVSFTRLPISIYSNWYWDEALDQLFCMMLQFL